ncbi:MAG: Sulfate/thiosulfate import ATP-binding protein CysA [Candidatus Celerinatantimonas neptuna]|nr:MAG: Sulfate/thiosulfate import ATP-binding protein CysA [Candidatus Celerinatantimonas neptuna]
MSGLNICFQRQLESFSLDVNESLPGNGISVLFGASGCGKTTILRALAGLERLPDSYCRLGDSLWQDEKQKLFVPTYRRSIGYVFQEASLFPHLSVRQNLEFGWQHISKSQRKVQFDEICQLLGIADKLSRRPGSLSGGERQRVAIARALLTSPELLLMDEPLSALDLARKQEFLPYLERLHRELDIPIVYVSHAPDEVIRLADHLVLLESGHVVLSGELQATLLDPSSARLFADGASSVIEAVVTRHQNGLTELAVGHLTFYLSKRNVTVGTRLRCRIFASDVSISLEEQRDSTILNRLPVTIDAINELPHRPQERLIRLTTADGVSLLAQISRYSCERLALRTGRPVWAQIKSVAILS